MSHGLYNSSVPNKFSSLCTEIEAFEIFQNFREISPKNFHKRKFRKFYSLWYPKIFRCQKSHGKSRSKKSKNFLKIRIFKGSRE